MRDRPDFNPSLRMPALDDRSTWKRRIVTLATPGGRSSIHDGSDTFTSTPSIDEATHPTRQLPEPFARAPAALKEIFDKLVERQLISVCSSDARVPSIL